MLNHLLLLALLGFSSLNLALTAVNESLVSSIANQDNPPVGY